MLFDMKGGFSYSSHVDWILFGKEPRMRSFELFLPTRLIYGADCLEKLSSATAAYGRKALVLYGGGSVVRSGLLDRVKAALPGVECVDFAGIEPNPRIESVRRAVKVCRDESVDFIVAVGGCMTQQTAMAEKLKKSFPYVDIVFGTHALWRLPELDAALAQQPPFAEFETDWGSLRLGASVNADGYTLRDGQLVYTGGANFPDVFFSFMVWKG